MGVASNPEKLAETAFLQYPTRDNPIQYLIYQGTQRSHPITEDDIPWWVLLAIVLREADTQTRCKAREAPSPPATLLSDP